MGLRVQDTEDFQRLTARRDELQDRFERHLAGIAGYGRSDDIMNSDALEDNRGRHSALVNYIATLEDCWEVTYAPC